MVFFSSFPVIFTMPSYTDQTGREIFIPAPPRRIISLVPSQTEFLYDLGLSREVVGITKFCVHPNSWFREKTRVGGTKDLRISQILQLSPDLVIANKEENSREQIEQLAETLPVWVSDVANLPDALDMMRSLGRITQTSATAEKICASIESAFIHIHPAGEPFTTAYLIWREPYMTVGRDTFIHDMLGRCGLVNAFAATTRYPEISIAELAAARVNLVLLASEPYPFKEQHAQELRQALPGCKVVLVDGEFFSWYGSRLLAAAQYFNILVQELSARH